MQAKSAKNEREGLLDQGRYIVVDIGKTLSKVSLWTAGGRLLDRQTRPNRRPVVNGIRRLDLDGISRWLPNALRAYAGQPVQAVVPVTHGAAVVALRDGRPTALPLDYEAEPPQAVRDEYRAQRDSFAATGSPELPGGQNLGLQLHWLEQLQPHALSEAQLLPWAQFWSWWLSGAAASEVSSLGCHTDLWQPAACDFSQLAVRRGWAGKFAPFIAAGEVIGTLRPELARECGLSPRVRVYAGLHDSNAALLAARGFTEVAEREATVLSTGTWFVAMRHLADAGTLPCLPEGRDCLLNVDPFATPVPSARFMGGREIESLIKLDTRQVDIAPDQPRLLASVPGVLAAGAMVLPALAAKCGPFPEKIGGWVAMPADWYARRAAACLYAALVVDVSLDLIGSRETLLIEGRFAEAQVFIRALAALRPNTTVYVGNQHNDVALGALRLIDPNLRPAAGLDKVLPIGGDLAGYRHQWRNRLERGA